ncbi:MAG: hypothetical protein IBX55_19955 [Methyloprofundus sp.]|nr:hypothetical protein [Methyloprofundus sp.]
MIILQFTARRKIGSWLIRQFTWSDYSHVDIVLPDGRLLGARLDGGVSIQPTGDFEKCLRVAVDAPDHVIDIALTQIGKHYDISAIFGIIFRRDWHKPKKWFCSELVAWAFEQAGTPLLRTENFNRVTPRDLLMSPLIKLIE